MKEHIIEFLILFFTMLTLGWALMRSIDLSSQNQDIMLCNSAKISGNLQYLQKCQCYYEGEPITCIQDK
jgi:hypothetical protein